MSILRTMFVKQFNFRCSVTLSKGFFCYFCCNVKSQKRKSKLFQLSWTTAKNLLSGLRRAFYNLKIAAILLANTRKSLNFHCFKSVQNFNQFKLHKTPSLLRNYFIWHTKNYFILRPILSYETETTEVRDQDRNRSERAEIKTETYSPFKSTHLLYVIMLPHADFSRKVKIFPVKSI